jgi:NADH dehydrogenase FAD-containing subunit
VVVIGGGYGGIAVASVLRVMVIKVRIGLRSFNGKTPCRPML